jgi:mono/diheme cytochrome c family protein
MKQQRGFTAVAGCLWAAVAFSMIFGAALIEAPARAITILDAEPVSLADGREVYEHICQGCHMPDGGGAIGAGHYPALAKNRNLASRQFMALTLLMGRRNMPAFGAKHAIAQIGRPAVLTDVQIAAVINYVRMHFGNHYTDAITAAEVAALDPAAAPGVDSH